MRQISILITFLLLSSFAEATTITDGFSGTSLLPGWTITSGDTSNYNVSGGKLNITNTIGGSLLGPWSMFRVRHSFQTNRDFEIDVFFNYVREDYKIYTISLLDSLGNQKLQMRIWDSPSKWLISGYNDSTWWVTQSTSYTPNHALLQRVQDTVSLIWDGTVQAKGFWPQNTAFIEIAVGDYDANMSTVAIDSIYASTRTPEPPSTPSLTQPVDSTGMPIFTVLPTFKWQASIDPDSTDTIRYKLQIASNPSFTFLTTIDSIANNQYTLTDSLEFGKHYYWRVTAFDTDGFMVQSATSNYWTWMLGDVNSSHTLNVLDLNYMVSYFFSGGPAISPHFVGDLNGSCSVNVLDLNYLVAYFFSGGPAPKIGCGP